MATRIDCDERRPTVQTRVWIDEHDWLHGIFKSPHNTSPKFRFPDLLSACVSLAFRDSANQARLITYVLTQLSLRDPKTERRSCDIWAPQFELLLDAHRGPWNSFPNSKFDIDAIATACVAVSRLSGDAVASVLRQVRANFRARCSTGNSPLN